MLPIILRSEQTAALRSVARTAARAFGATCTNIHSINNVNSIKWAPQSLRQAQAEASRCLGCIDRPCSAACPAQTDPATFVRQLGPMDNPMGAAETILRNNPLGGVCGAVCPVSKLCEGACTRTKVDGTPVRIGALQHFLHDYGMKQQQQHAIRSPTKLSRVDQTVAVVGSGPAGLSTARELQRLGYDVTLYEARAEPGGALRYFLSPLRMDHNLVREEVARIQDLGVNIVCNHRVTDLEKLKKEFDHVVVAPGLGEGRSMEGIPSSLTALEFLESSNTDATMATKAVEGKRVVVVGGGSVACDAAITSKALGASNVTMMFRESLKDMPADIDEINLARSHHVTLLPERTIDVDASSSIEKNSLLVKHVNDFNEQDQLCADTIIFALGQEVARQDTKNLLDRPSIAYAGDVTSGGATVVQAIAQGKQVADEIAQSSSGRSLSDLNKALHEEEEKLRIDFCGIDFPNPFSLSSSPVTNTAEMCARAFDAGWGGVVYKTLNIDSEMKILHPSPRLGAVHDVGESSRMGIGIQNVEQISDRTLEDNLQDISILKSNYPDNVLGVSIMGFSDESWGYLAEAAEGSGADWIELNFSCPQMHAPGAGHKVGQDNELIQRYTEAAKSACSIPVVAKMTPNLTDMLPAALAAQEGGADGVSAVNTFKAISHVNLDYHGSDYRPQPNIQGFSSISGFSGPACRPMALRFIAEMAKDSRLTIPISAMGGMQTWRDAVEFLSLGASNLQCTTAVMRYGVNIVDDLKDGLLRHLHRMGHMQLSDMVGASLPSLCPPEELDLTTESVSTIIPEKCVGCGACLISCRDGATDAIHLQPNGKAFVDPSKCVGCGLCSFVCPIDGAVTMSTRPRIKRSVT